MQNRVQRKLFGRIQTLLAISFCLAIYGCDQGGPSRDPAIRQRRAELPAQSVPSEASAQHISQEIVLRFIADCKSRRYAESPIEFPCDFELSPVNRLKAFRRLERYIKSDSWTTTFTAVYVIEGLEDSTDIYFRGSHGGWLLLMCGYHYHTDEWKLDAYEIPEMTFVRPENETFDEYMERSLEELRAKAEPYVEGETADGIYFIE